MNEPRTPHRRRTPCCQIEAFRYLTTHGYDVDDAPTSLTASDLLDEWVRTGDFPQSKGGWTVPRMIAAIWSSPHPAAPLLPSSATESATPTIEGEPQ